MSVGPLVGPLVVKMSKKVENGHVGASVLPQLRVLVSESAVIFSESAVIFSESTQFIITEVEENLLK